MNASSNTSNEIASKLLCGMLAIRYDLNCMYDEANNLSDGDKALLLSAGYNYTRQLDYYKNNNVTADNYAGAIKKYGNVSWDWWLGDADSREAYYFFIVDDSGQWNDGGILWDSVSPAFRIDSLVEVTK